MALKTGILTEFLDKGGKTQESSCKGGDSFVMKNPARAAGGGSLSSGEGHTGLTDQLAKWPSQPYDAGWGSSRRTFLLRMVINVLSYRFIDLKN